MFQRLYEKESFEFPGNSRRLFLFRKQDDLNAFQKMQAARLGSIQRIFGLSKSDESPHPSLSLVDST